MIRLLSKVTLILLLSTGAVSAASEESRFSVAGTMSDAEVYEFLRDLQTALKARDKAVIADMLSTSVRVFNDGKAQSKTAKAALTRFDDVFDPYVTAVIQCQTPDSLWANWRGISIGRGTVWVNLELQISTKTYDKNPEQYPSSDRRYWKMKISTINRGKISKEEASECP